MENLTRANKVTVNVVADGSYKADFYRTHKHICTVISTDTEFTPTEGMTKSGVRELFRAFVIQNAEQYGVLWNPADLRADNNIRKSSYETDEDLVEDAMAMILPMMKQLADTCKYPILWKGISHEDISSVDHTAKGTPLSSMGIIDGKYEKSGKWAWATIGFTVTLAFKSEEIYMPIKMELVSGQLKEPKIGITLFNETVKQEILDAGLATAEELDPPKEPKAKKSEPKSDEESSEPVVIDVTVEEPKKSKGGRKANGKKNAEVAE